MDVGCGTVSLDHTVFDESDLAEGIWLAEMAECFPHVDCVGIDITPNQHE
jgi:hypothetical protein